MANVEWLLREAMDERALRISERTVIDDPSWRATIERLEIGPGLRVFLTDAQAHKDVTVEARDNRTDQWIGSQVTITSVGRSAEKQIQLAANGSVVGWQRNIQGHVFGMCNPLNDIPRLLRLYQGSLRISRPSMRIGLDRPRSTSAIPAAVAASEEARTRSSAVSPST